MKAVKQVRWAGVFTILAALGIWAWAWQARQQAVRRNAMARAAADSAMESERRAEAAVTASKRSIAQFKSPRTARPVSAPGLAGLVLPADGSAILAKHPELQRAFEKAYAANRERVYDPLYRKLGLTKDQIDRLDLLMAKDVENSIDLYSVAQSRNLPMSDPAIASLQQQQKADLQAQESTVMGASDFQAFEAFDAEMPVRNVVKLANSLAVASESGLAADQEEQVTQTLLQGNASHAQNPTQPIDPTTVNWSAGADQASSILNDNQVAALKAAAALQTLVSYSQQYFAQKAGNAKK